MLDGSRPELKGVAVLLGHAPLQAEVLGEIEDRLVGYLQKGTGALSQL